MMKRLICLLLAMILMTSTIAFAEALREDPKLKVKNITRQKDGDLVYEDFTGVAEGTVPATFTGGGANVTTAPYEVLPGYTKNCLQITDTTHEKDYSGTSTNFITSAVTGVVEVEFRYKYVPVAPSTYSSFDMQFHGNNGQFSRTTVASANGATHFNYGGTGSAALESTQVAPDTWYVLRYFIDFETETINASLTNEGTKKVTSVNGMTWMSGTGHKSFNKLVFLSQVYGGIWVVDYIRVAKHSEIPEMNVTDPYADLKKGVEQIKIPAPVSHAVEDRINITFDGKYKYTASTPYVADGGSVMVSAKNFADMFDLGYLRKDSTFTITKDDTVITLTANSDEIKVGKKSAKLKDKTVLRGTQLYVPADALCEAIGVDYAYDDETSTVVLTTAASQTEEGGNE